MNYDGDETWQRYLKTRSKLVTHLSSFGGASQFESTTTSGSVGLSNSSSTCFLNSLLQLLYHQPEVRHHIYNSNSENNNIRLQLQLLFARLQTTKRRSISTTPLTTAFGWSLNTLHMQQDVHELLTILLDSVDVDPITNLFNITINDSILGSCNHSSKRAETMLDLQLNVTEDNTKNNVRSALSVVLEQETLTDDCQWYCETCDGKVSERAL